jgi:hypothetical protein
MTGKFDWRQEPQKLGFVLLEVSNGKRKRMCGYHAQFFLRFSVSVALSVSLTPITDVGTTEPL